MYVWDSVRYNNSSLRSTFALKSGYGPRREIMESDGKKAHETEDYGEDQKKFRPACGEKLHAAC